MKNEANIWRNTRDLYIQYCYLEELCGAAQQLLATYGKFFNDESSYWLTKSKKALALGGIVKRRPLWMGKQKHIPTEKPKHAEL